MVTSVEIHRGKILIVDDQEANVRVLERMLGGAGYTDVSSTRDPTEVHDLHLKNNYDLILLDLKMPGMDGFQVMESLKEIETGGYLPVLMLTAQPDHKLLALRSGAKDFISKPLDLSEVLARVYNMLEVRLLHMETKRLYEQVLEHEQTSERLMLNLVPQFIADRLKERPGSLLDSPSEIIADNFPDATVLFADIVDFPMVSMGLNPQELVRVLNEIFGEFDRLCKDRGLEKIKTTGGAYLAVAGIPDATSDHAARAAETALDMLKVMFRFNTRLRERRSSNLQIRIGINTGPVIAGVIGSSRKFIYDVWGDTVSAACRIESDHLPGRVRISGSTSKRLDDTFLIEQHGVADALLLAGRRVIAAHAGWHDRRN